MKKLVSLLLALTLVFGAAVAETSILNKDAVYPVVTSELTLDMLGPRDAAQGEWQDLKFFKKWQELTGVTLNIETVPEDNWDTSLNLRMMEEGDLPDFIYAGQITAAQEIDWGDDQGILLPLENLIAEYMPNLSALLEANPILKSSITTPEGHIYCLPWINDMPRDLTSGKYWINNAWMQKLGIAEPTTVDELYATLKAFKEKDPNGNGIADEIPYSGQKDIVDFYRTVAWWGKNVDNTTLLGTTDNGEVYYGPLTEEWKEMVTFWANAWADGLVDPQIFEMDSAALKAKGQAAGDQTLGMFQGAGAFLFIPSEQNEEYSIVGCLVKNEGDTPVWSRTTGLSRGTLAITCECEYPEVVCRMADWVYEWKEYEGGIFNMRGESGVDFYYVDDNGNEVAIPGAGNVTYMRGCDYASNSFSLESLFSQCSAGGMQGFDAKYWNSARGTGEPDVLRHNTTPLRFSTAGATVFAPNVNLENFAAEYNAVFHALEDGDVAMFMQNQGNAELFIDGRKVVTGKNGDELKKVYTLKAQAGRDYDIRITFASLSGQASLQFDLGYEKETTVASTVAATAGSDVVIFAGGISPALEGEEMPVSIPGFKGGDRTAIELPDAQTELVKALKAAGRKVVFVNFSGSAVALTDAAPSCDAILQAWYPGQEGGTAVASVLYGQYNPAGRLPVTFYKSTSQLPDFEDYSMKGRTYRYMTEKPLFPFGHGLSYTTFRYGKARLSGNTVAKGGSVTLTVPVTNSGPMDGQEVIQAYVKRLKDNDGPSLALRAFRRVAVMKGETAQVKIDLDWNSFEWFDTGHNVMTPLPGKYEVYYGGTSDLTQLQKVTVTVK